MIYGFIEKRTHESLDPQKVKLFYGDMWWWKSREIIYLVLIIVLEINHLIIERNFM